MAEVFHLPVKSIRWIKSNYRNLFFSLYLKRKVQGARMVRGPCLASNPGTVSSTSCVTLDGSVNLSELCCPCF